MASTPERAALGRRSSNRVTVAVLVVLIAVVVLVGVTVASHHLGANFSSVSDGLGT